MHRGSGGSVVGSGCGGVMHRSRKILITCHCILNVNAKVYPLADTGGVHTDAVRSYVASGCGLFQLPCPELSYLGMHRWGMTKEQYDHANFRKHCQDILEHPMLELQALAQAGYEWVGIMGMDGSPNCGVEMTCEGYTGGELCSRANLSEQVKSLRYIKGQGVFMEELIEMMHKRDLRPKLLSIKEKKSIV